LNLQTVGVHNLPRIEIIRHIPSLSNKNTCIIKNRSIIVEFECDIKSQLEVAVLKLFQDAVIGDPSNSFGVNIHLLESDESKLNTFKLQNCKIKSVQYLDLKYEDSTTQRIHVEIDYKFANLYFHKSDSTFKLS
jgi:hypothetical protein